LPDRHARGVADLVDLFCDLVFIKCNEFA
jgi:hypothetical protein